MTIRKVTSPGNFRMLLGTRAECFDPAWDGYTIPTPRTTVDQGVVVKGGTNRNARITGTAPPVGQTAVFTVADNDFTTGRAEVHIGNVRLLSVLDFVIGAGVNNTATNIATAISTLEDFVAVAVGAVVTVTYLPPMDEVTFRVAHYGTVTNFTPLVPATGFMTSTGDPVIGPPLFT